MHAVLFGFQSYWKEMHFDGGDEVVAVTTQAKMGKESSQGKTTLAQTVRMAAWPLLWSNDR